MKIFPCPKCGHQNWSGQDYPCEDCGTHSGVICNGCGEQWDHVWGDEVYDKVLDSYGVDDPFDIQKLRERGHIK